VRRRLRLAVTAAALVALAVSPAVAAHSDGGALGFRSTVTGLSPPAANVGVRVLHDDDRLELTNSTGRRLVVLGYEGEPYLEFRNGGVYRNLRSPATYLNDDRFGDVEIPAEADPKAEPRWERVSPRERYDWHDHRIHWMSRELPPKVEATKDQAQPRLRLEGARDARRGDARHRRLARLRASPPGTADGAPRGARSGRRAGWSSGAAAAPSGAPNVGD
jgi:hypothetical protein